MPQKTVNIGEYRALAAVKQPRVRNYKPTFIGSERFASKREARCWQELQVLFHAKKITGLKRQVRIPLTTTPDTGGDPVAVCHYVADFTFFEDGQYVIADAKGWATDLYKLKRKWVRLQYGIEIREL